MFVKGLTLLLVASTFHGFGVDGEIQNVNDVMKSVECIVPWALSNVPFLHYNDTTTCPKILDDEDKKYCCMNFDFEVICCDMVQYLIFGFVLFSPVIGILVALCCCCWCFCCGKLLCCV